MGNNNICNFCNIKFQKFEEKLNLNLLTGEIVDISNSIILFLR